MDSDQPSEIIKEDSAQEIIIADSSSDRSSLLAPWQIGVLAVAVILATVFVMNGGEDHGGEIGGVTPTTTLPPVITNTPTPTPTASAAEGTPSTSTPTSTATPTYTPTPTATPTPIVVINRIEALGRLETAKYVMQTVVDIEKEPGNVFERVLGTDKLLLIAGGEVVAGFDLEQVEADDITIRGTVLTLKLPPPEIFYSRVDNEKTYIYVRSSGILQKPDPDLETEARRLAEQQLNEWALENEILDQAETFGLIFLENFLESLGFTEVNLDVTTKR